MTRIVRDFLDRSPAARAVASLDLGGQRTVTLWENRNDRITYDAPQGHAFSLYLAGGTGTRRLDKGDGTGRPGTVCILPEGHRSHWEITTPFRFVHLYVPHDRLSAAFAAIHDRDARHLGLAEATFAELPVLVGPLSRLAEAAVAGDVFLGDAAFADLVSGLGPRRVTLRGGLSPRVLRRLDAWIEARLGDTIRLEHLAAVADLSPFHLNRMFKASRGVTPHTWIAQRRIERAKRMLRDRVPIVEVALSCGFSSQSHFTRIFRAHTGTTPATYAQAHRET